MVSKLTAAVGNFGTAKVENGLEMKDSATGAVYCVRITNGEFAKQIGFCADIEAAPAASGTGSQSSGNIGTDTTPPSLVVNGNNPANIEVNSTYADLGATVSDNVDNNLGVKASLDNENWIEVGNLQLNTASSTTYTIYYKATDGAGNIGTAERIVNVGIVTQNPPSSQTTPPPLGTEELQATTTPSVAEEPAAEEVATTTPTTPEPEVVEETAPEPTQTETEVILETAPETATTTSENITETP